MQSKMTSKICIIYSNCNKETSQSTDGNDYRATAGLTQTSKATRQDGIYSSDMN